MFDKYEAELICFIKRSLDDIRSGRGKRITGTYRFARIEVYIDIKKDEEEN